MIFPFSSISYAYNELFFSFLKRSSFVEELITTFPEVMFAFTTTLTRLIGISPTSGFEFSKNAIVNVRSAFSVTLTFLVNVISRISF